MAYSMSYRPGHIVPVSGIYSEVTDRNFLSGRNVTCVSGKPFPPTQDNFYRYVLKIRTNIR
jgi:hypothetical protein